MGNSVIYLDHAATTATDGRVLEAMLPYFSQVFGNASSLHCAGREANRAVAAARTEVAKALGAKPSEIYFTSGGTESDNFAIRGAAYAAKERGTHIVSTRIEHHAALNTLARLEKEGFSVTYVGVDGAGRVHPEEVEKALRPDTVLVSVMTANNEVGTIQPIAEIGALTRARGVVFHTDAVQAVGNLPLDVNAMNVDLLSLSAHKFYGPKGVGALYIRDGLPCERLIYGGAQERGLRAGTLNTAGVVGLGKAISIATESLIENSRRISALAESFTGRITRAITGARFNGSDICGERLPGIVNLSFDGISGSDGLLTSLDMAGICASSGAACASGISEASRVLLAMGVSSELASASLRFSFGRENTESEVEIAVKAVCEAVERVRAVAPLIKIVDAEKYKV